jgi:putative pyruvate formate lyase activating enzyme
MHRQVGPLIVDRNGLAQRGLILRHLVMPGSIAGTREILQWLARDLGPDTYVNVMSQYFPAGKVSASEHAEINRNVTLQEFQEALDAAHEAGLRRLDPRAPIRAMLG